MTSGKTDKKPLTSGAHYTKNEQKNKPSFSFELFPYKITDDKAKIISKFHNLYQKLLSVEPSFCSLTYGALGSEELKSEILLKEMLKYDTKVYAHITIINKSKSHVIDTIKRWYDMGVSGFVILRGDSSVVKRKPKNEESYDYVHDLIKDIRAILSDKVVLVVASYPEKHPAARTQTADIKHLLRKFEGGADFSLSQFFFKPQTFIDFKEKVDRLSDKPIDIYPGIMPIYNFEKIASFSQKSETLIPQVIREKFNAETNTDKLKNLTFEICYQQCLDLIEAKVEHLHFYTLNLYTIVNKIVREIKAKY